MDYVAEGKVLAPLKAEQRLMIWNKCNICGKIIAYKDFESGKAVNKLLTPSAYGSEEEWDTYHIDCVRLGKQEETDAIPNLRRRVQR